MPIRYSDTDDEHDIIIYCYECGVILFWADDIEGDCDWMGKECICEECYQKKPRCRGI